MYYLDQVSGCGDHRGGSLLVEYVQLREFMLGCERFERSLVRRDRA